MSQLLASEIVGKGLNAFLERVERQEPLSAAEARQLLASCDLPIVLLERYWQLVQGSLDRGMERESLLVLLKEAMDNLEQGARTFATARTRINSADLASEERTAGSDMLEYAHARASRMLGELSSLYNRLTAPPREMEVATLPEERDQQ